MSEVTLGSLIDLIRSNRNAREENVRTMNDESPAMSGALRVQIAVSDQEFRQQLGEMEELPSLLQYAAKLQEGWPYPSDEAIALFRAHVAQLGHRKLNEIDSLRLSEALAIIHGNEASLHSSNGRTSEISAHFEVDPSKLPHWAQIAFITRCARRAYRLLLAEVKEKEPERFDWIDQSLQVAERSATIGKPDESLANLATQAIQRANGRISFGRFLGDEAREIPLSEQLLHAAGNAAGEAARACLAGGEKSSSESFEQSQRAALIVGSNISLELMTKDWNYLRAISEKDKWTDATPVSPERVPTPRLKLTGLHLKGLRAIRKLDLPQDGLGWRDTVPDLILIGGANGSGKTTLLQFLAAALQALLRPWQENFVAVIPESLDAEEAWAEFEIEAFELEKTRLRFLVGSEEFISKNRGENSWFLSRTNGPGAMYHLKGNGAIAAMNIISKWFAETTFPGALYFSSEDRSLVVPPDDFKSAGKLRTQGEFVYRWKRPTNWKESLEAVFYASRWEDLNAREENRFNEIGKFEAYSSAFRRFNGKDKYLSWVQAELVVRLTNSSRFHDLSTLSSGEKQVLLLSGEILRHWRPGSLVMIDEPELHLHSTWQTKLYEAFRFWQLERGGQLILATQSSHLFSLADPGTAVLVGVDSL